jgi:hypothetical protein
VRLLQPTELNSRPIQELPVPRLARLRRTSSDPELALVEVRGADPEGRILPLLRLEARYWISERVAGARFRGYGLLDLSQAHPRW